MLSEIAPAIFLSNEKADHEIFHSFTDTYWFDRVDGLRASNAGHRSGSYPGSRSCAGTGCCSRTCRCAWSKRCAWGARRSRCVRRFRCIRRRGCVWYTRRARCARCPRRCRRTCSGELGRSSRRRAEVRGCECNRAFGHRSHERHVPASRVVVATGRSTGAMHTIQALFGGLFHAMTTF